MNRFQSIIAAIALVMSMGNVSAQEKQTVTIKSSAENSKFTQSLNISIGDKPNHIMRTFEVHRTFTSDSPVINGLKIVEECDRGIAELVDGNGTSIVYDVFVMENGDQFTVRAATVVQNISGKTTVTEVGQIESGTGRLAGIRGALRGSTNIDLKSGFNESQSVIDYAISK